MTTATARHPASPPAALVPAPVRVRDLRPETSDVTTLVIDGVPAAAPGQFNMLYAFGVGEAAISVSGDPADPTTTVHSVRAVGAVTRALCRVQPGGVIGLRGPFGHSWPLAEAEGGDLLIVGGGLGLAPLRPVIYHAVRHRARYGRVVVLAGARTPADLLYADELARLARDTAARLDVRVIVDRAGADWTGRVGVVPALIPEVDLDRARTFAFVCGPETMMRFTLRPLERAGVPDARIFVSLERNMKCAVGFCGHCMLGPTFVCKDGPVLPFDRLRATFFLREL